MIQEASLTGFLRTILIILLVYYAIKILTRMFAPYLVRYMSKKMQQRFGGQFQQYQEPRQQYKEGETIIDKMPEKESSSNKKVGEYIDYEEID
ncbi:DUF4834 family protein [Psychroserpens sp.]|uniref:DUF4834 family protein n=1 Tax=Psychroserpens sp. TaxID=2020870 RepID=UPI001B2485D4|nr:DUF4834 family protein [Psychroserpens sp.]MBO6606573.1 DUF4834 family protein [Psychroserpens sp.]MBO6631863.1 DUF4834 family protein [Psychroserpens sp.]MBO6653277.1 DUF4834 family protein [Psychroserpens sp.]MBO6680696.1 DUF4834 family protein [Psychroserpens sp.]MBO6750346.1 DUF4834 family protein [Psychroserpens sp.]